MLKTLKNSKGFTIIELLIVIAIIVILAGLVLNNFQGAQAKARDTQRITDINTLHSKLEERYNEQGGYPSTLTVANFPGIDAGALEDADGNPPTVTISDDSTAAAAITAPTNAAEYQYNTWPTGCVDDCEGYFLKTFVEKPAEGEDAVFSKTGLNNPST